VVRVGRPREHLDRRHLPRRARRGRARRRPGRPRRRRARRHALDPGALAGENPLLWVGVGIVGVVLAEWLVQGWAERATADPAFNQALRHRIMLPFEIPAVGLLVIGGVLIALSRVLLAVSENGSRVIALVVASAILAVAFVIAYRPRLSSSVLGGLLAAGAVALVAAGIAGGIAGEREVEHHEPAAEHEEESTTDSSTPAADDTTETTTSSAGH
jgi:hypothetical protein